MMKTKIRKNSNYRQGVKYKAPWHNYYWQALEHYDMKKNGRIPIIEYKKAMYEIFHRAQGRCQNCQAALPHKISCLAHVKSKNLSTREEVLTRAVAVCELLHVYSHTRAKNLEENHCVRLYLQKYGSEKPFFQPLWDELQEGKA